MNAYNPLTHGFRSQVSELDRFIEQSLRDGNIQDLVRLNTYLRRYISPLVTRDLFRQNQLSILLKRQETTAITAVVLDMRGFVRTTQSSERTNEGLDAVARLLRLFFSRIIRIAFEHYGLVGEFAGDRVLIIFGFPPPSILGDVNTEVEDLVISVQMALGTVFAIQGVIEGIKSDQSFAPSLRQFEVGIGICAGGPAWVGDIGSDHYLVTEDSWRQELTFISSVVNIAARAEEMTKNERLMGRAPDRKIIVDKSVVDQIRELASDDYYTAEDLGECHVRGLDEKVHLFHLISVEPEILSSAEQIGEEDRLLVDWICSHIDGAIERDTINKVHRSLTDVGQIIASDVAPDEEAVFGQIMARIIASFEAQKATLYRVDPISEQLEVMSSVGPDSLATGMQFPLGEGIAGRVGAEGEALVSADVHTDDTWAGQKSGSKFDQAIHSMMCTPLMVGDEIIGVIQVMDDEVGKFNEADFSELSLFAELATIALRNAQIYDQERRAADARLMITEAFSRAQTQDEVLDAVMKAVGDTLDARNATLYSLDSEAGQLIFEKIIVDSENPPENPPSWGTRIPADVGIVGDVITRKTTDLVHDAENDARHYGRYGSDIRSIITVPLIARGEAVGAIQVLHQAPNFFNDKDLEMLNWLAASAAVAVDNAAQLDQARRKLVASNTVAGMANIAAKLAHNLGSQISGIETIAKRMLRTDDEKTQNWIGMIIRAAHEALAEVENFTRPIKEEVKPTNVDVDATLRELVVEVNESLKERLRLEERPEISIEHQPFEGGPILVYAVKDEIKYVFRNLIDNGIRAVEDKGDPRGRIALKTSLEKITGAEWVVVSVEDTGVGIPPENLERIFRQSFTTRSEGTVGGFGLFWVQLNVERIGGRITVDTEVDVGTTFHVRFPCLMKAPQ